MDMSKYKLIAFDMDGTLLNSEKRISERTLESVNRAFDAGKPVLFFFFFCFFFFL